MSGQTPPRVLCSLTTLFILRNCRNYLLWIGLFYTAKFSALVISVCFYFYLVRVCLMLSWPIPDTECSSSKIDQAAQSSLLILKQRSWITLPLDAQIRLSGIMMISVILFWNWGKKAQTVSLLWEIRIVFMWRDAGNINLPITQLSFTKWPSV